MSYTYDTFYDHYVIKKDGKILYHIDTEAEAKKDIFLLSSENIDKEVSVISNQKNYTVYHLHTEDSLLDSCTNYKEYIDKAKELGMKSIAFTEHGNIFHWASKYFYCKDNGIKYIHGIECYLTETLEEKIRDNYHTILLAKNIEGFKEINKLYKLSTQEDHTYYKPRLTFKEFLNISDNVIKISACLQSPLWKMYNDILSKRKEDPNQVYREDLFCKLLEHYDYYEIQYHNTEDQIEFNKFLYDMSKAYNKPLIVGTDTHSISKYKAECRTVLQYGKTDGVWGDSENECDLVFKTYNELIEVFEKQNSLPMDIILEAIENTNIMANDIEELSFDCNNKYPFLYGEKDEEVLWNVLKTKYKEKVERGEIEDNPKYWEQINEEMRVFKKIDMIGFMLFMSEIVSWARDNDIAVGFARGSCFTKDAIVLTKNGYKNINEINIGDKVIGDDGNWHNVTATQEYNVCEPMIEIEHKKQGSIINKHNYKCTYDHKVLVKRNNEIKYIPSYELKVGDLLCSPKIKHNCTNTITLDLNDYNIFGYEYDNEYIYEKVLTNRQYKYSSHWFKNNGYKDINSTFIKKIINGYKPKNSTIVNKILSITNFNSLEEYRRYCLDNIYTIRKIKRFVTLDNDFNKIIGLMYGDGNTTKYGIELATNNTTKVDNKNLFYKVFNNIIYENISIREYSSKNKNLIKTSLDCKIISNMWKTLFFESKFNITKQFNTMLYNQTRDNLKSLLDGLICSDGSITDNKYKKSVSFSNTSFSLISAYKILDNIVNQDCITYLTYRNQYDNCKESYSCDKVYNKRHIVESDDDYWYLPITKINYLNKERNTVYDLTVEECHSFVVNNIVVHNCAGSTVAYISDITDVDPIKWKTIFSRFANENRIEAGDIDTDWYEDDRQKIYDYIIDRFGLDKTSYILAVGTLADKSVIDTIGKAFRVKYGNDNTEYTLEKIKEIKAEWDKFPKETIKEKYPDLFYYYDGLVGCVISQSQHPAGIIVSPLTLEDNYGMFIGSDGQEILPLDMDECHDMGLIKFDILGLKSIGVIDKTCKLIGAKFPRAYQVNWNDQNVYDDMTKDHTAIFQFESDFAGKSLQTMKCKSVFDISLVNACIRPSGESYRDKLLNKIPNKNPSEIIDKLLENNYGHLVYQEDTIAFLQQICGFSGSEADNVRRAIGRKQVDRLNEALPKILDGYCSKSDKPREIAEEEAKTFLKIIEDASSYQFGYNHSIAYSLISYMCGYLRYYYPTEFCTSFLNCAKNDEDIANGTLLATNKGCKIETPLFRFSTSDYGCNSETKTIYKGIGSIKDIGKKCGDNLYSLKDNYYETFVDLLFDIVNNSMANKTEMKKLIYIDFFKEFGDINKLKEIYNIFLSMYKRKTFKVSECENYLLDKEEVSKISEKTTDKQFSGVDMRKLLKLILKNIHKPKTTTLEHISYELGILGYTNYTDKETEDNIYVVSVVDENKYGTKFLTLYNPRNAEYFQVKANKRTFEEHPCECGDILKCAFKKKQKRKKEIIDDKETWVETEEEENILSDFLIMKSIEY